MVIVGADQETNNEGGGYLEWAVAGKGGGGDDEEVGGSDGDTGDSFVGGEEVVRKDVAEERGSSVRHEGKAFHDEIEMPDDRVVHLPLSMAAVIDDRCAHFNLGVTVEPSLAQHRSERSEELGGQIGVEDKLDVDPQGLGRSIEGRQQVGALPNETLTIILRRS